MVSYANESTGPKPVMDMDRESEERFVRFIERMPTDYFSAHGEDAILVANSIYKTTNVIKYLGSSSHPAASSSSSSSSSTFPSRGRGLPSVTISTPLTKMFLRDILTSKQMRVEIYVPEELAGGRKNHAKWVMDKMASPGNVSQVEDLLFGNEDMNGSAVSMALKISIKEGIRTVGAAFVDSGERVLGVCEFVDDEGFGNTESLLIQLGIKECILPSDDKRADHELTKLRTLIQRCNIIVTERKPADFMIKNVEQDIRRLLSEESTKTGLPELDLKTAMSALSALIITNSLLADARLHNTYHLVTHDLSQYMKLDASALKALNLMPAPNELGASQKNMSVFGLLDKCKTAQGKRLLQRWLKQPLVNLHEIINRQKVVQAFYDDAHTRRALQDTHLKQMPDLHRLSKKFTRGVATLQDVVRVYQAVDELSRMVTTLLEMKIEPESTEVIQEKYIAPLKDHDEKLQTYRDMVQETIDLRLLDRHDYALLPSLDSELQRIEDELLATRDELDAEHVRVAKDLNVDMDKKLHLENHQVHKYSFRITKAEAGLLRTKNRKEGYYELSTQKSGTIFTTTTLRQLSDDYQRLQEEYQDKQRFLVKEVVDIASSYTPVLESLDDLIAVIDVTVSFAHVACNAPVAYVRPMLSERGTGDLVVRGARHPCLEVQDDVDFIANDHEMRKDKSEFIILTGPNMGGKSTYIRQIGVIALMAQIGSFVPADHAELPIFDCILARVGAGDSQLKGVSTFMAEMLETATILKSATKDSLVIIDELGRGTSTYDGFGLAWAISEHIASKTRAFCLFATHFHELTALADNLAHVTNLHVEALVSGNGTANQQSGKKVERDITLLYKVKEGVCDQSFGIHVAELANFPESVVRLAKRKAEELEDFGDGANQDSDQDEDQAAKVKSDAIFADFTDQENEEGMAMMKAFLADWRDKVEAEGLGEEGDAPSQSGSKEEREQRGKERDERYRQVGRRVYGEWKERFGASRWFQAVESGF